MTAHVLMLSSSRKNDEPYLAHAQPFIYEHLKGIKDVLFIPFAGVTISYDEYTQRVAEGLPTLNVTGLHQVSSPREAVENAIANNQAIMVGGGNTFHLLYTLYELDLIEPLKSAIADGLAYVGWSAGSNICGMTIRTTNDMPIIPPPSFDALDVLSCQLNPHYTDYSAPGHNGETRDQRLAEFTTVSPTTPVLAIREGTALKLTDNKLTLLGDLGGFVFLADEKHPINEGDDLTQFVDYCR